MSTLESPNDPTIRLFELYAFTALKKLLKSLNNIIKLTADYKGLVTRIYR